jgi:hypothetical protein
MSPIVHAGALVVSIGATRAKHATLGKMLMAASSVIMKAMPGPTAKLIRYKSTTPRALDHISDRMQIFIYFTIYDGI